VSTGTLPTDRLALTRAVTVGAVAVYTYLSLVFAAVFASSFTPAGIVALFAFAAGGYLALAKTREFHQFW